MESKLKESTMCGAGQLREAAGADSPRCEQCTCYKVTKKKK